MHPSSEIGRTDAATSAADTPRRQPVQNHIEVPIRDLRILEARPADVPLLVDLIRELAAFEQLERDVEVTGESLHAALFGDRPVAGALLARVADQPAGYALHFQTFSSFVGRPGLWLEDVYVRPSFRSRGVGRALIQAVIRHAAQLRAGRLEWAALRWNTRAVRFYEQLGARQLEEWVMFRMNSTTLNSLVGGDSHHA